jgi:hypothetical protein
MEETNKLAPIVLFCYNRPWHTQQTLDALALNEFASESDLIVYCDGPKKDLDDNTLQAISETRSVIKTEKRFNSIKIFESENNKGLAASIIDGVTEVVNRYGKIIVLEDDIVTSPGFLKYMNDALNVYQMDEKVMHISGYMFPIENLKQKTFFLRPTTCWGWATWDRAWRFFEKNIDKQIAELDKLNAWDNFTLNNSYPSYKIQLLLNKTGELNTWAIFWQSSVFLKQGLSLHPQISFTKNIGLDGSGTNCDSTNFYDVILLNKAFEIDKVKIKLDKVATKKLEYYFNSMTKSRKQTLRDKIYLFRKKIFKK